jgi:hypothetical protein
MGKIRGQKRVQGKRGAGKKGAGKRGKRKRLVARG